MNDLACWIMGWNEAGNERLAERLRGWGNVPNVFTRCCFYMSEAQNYDYVMRWSEQNDFHYILVADSDIEFLHRETIPKMYEWLSSNKDAGSIRPWRKGEPAQPSQYPPDVKYIEDGSALMWRLNTGAYYDQEYAFTAWGDMDFGEELEYRGFKNYSDRRYPVMHDMTGSNSHGRSSALNALKKRNKLIYDFKWWLIGRDKWQGVEAYNATVPIEKRIPTVNQIIAYSDEDQELFQSQVSVEHHRIWMKDSRKNPNLETWENPVITGIRTRDIWEVEHGYS